MLSKTMNKERILVIEDDNLAQESLTEIARSIGYRAEGVCSTEQALSKMDRELPDMVLADLEMPGLNGLQPLKAIQEKCPGLPMIVITSASSMETAVESMSIGVQDFLMKPCSHGALKVTLDKVLRQVRLERENALLRRQASGGEMPDAIAESPLMLTTMRSAARLSQSNGTILITGENGTGKKRVAQYIHRCSQRAEEPFVRVNCAALSKTMLESELFGHERGAFIGAHHQRMGRFELAAGGTLLLDEIGDLSIPVQAKLLRVLQEGEFERVGGQTTLKADVRVITSTNRDLAAEVAQGRFREDLYYRLHVLPIDLAPLRDRPEDLMPLAKNFAEVHARKYGMPLPVFKPECAQLLQAWHWPGNVRELDKVIHQAVILCHEGHICADDLVLGPPSPSSSHSSAPGTLELHDPAVAYAMADNEMSVIERIAILATIHSSGGNKTEAARRLGLTARTLSNKMRLWRASGLVA